MRFFNILATAASLLATYASAQNNPLAITAPLGGSLQAGTQYIIKWTPTTAPTVTLQLRYGSNAGNLAIGQAIAATVDNSGMFTWTIPAGLANTGYAIQITDSAGVTNYSPTFQVAGGTGDITTASTGKASVTAAPTTSMTTSTIKTTTSSASSSSASSSSATSKSTSGAPSSTSSAAATTTTAAKAPSSGAGKAGKAGEESLLAMLGLMAAYIVVA